MRVRIDASVFANQRYGGISRYLVELARGVNRKDGWEVKLDACVYINEYLHEAAGELNHQGIYLKRHLRGLDRVNSVLSRSANRLSWKGFDIVHWGFYDSNLSRSRGTRTVATFYDMINERFIHNSGETERKKKIASSAEHLIAISQSTKDDMVEFLDVDPRKISVSYLSSSIAPRVEQGEGGTREPYLLWVGNRNGYKNFSCLVEAFSLTKRAKSDLRIVCAGGPPISDRERERWCSLGLNPDRLVHVRPDEKELASLYTDAVALVYISSYEGFGIPPLEAMRCKCPVIASNVSSIPEVVGTAGILVDPREPEQVASAIEELHDSVERRESLVAAGETRSGQFSWDRCVEEHLQVYGGLT